tara:strand:+ start:838 stop:1731 length:894 start_codon:yes stop_codon:yes gene_type:complete
MKNISLKISTLNSSISSILEELELLLDSSNLFYGHGSGNAKDEALALILSVLKSDYPLGKERLTSKPSSDEFSIINSYLSERINTRKPMSYITREAYFCGHRFFIDERVLIPRSPIAEMIQNQMQPWIDMKEIRRVLEIGTGSGCIALSMAIEFPEIEVVASDISETALEVARINRKDKNLVDKVEFVHSDLFENISGKFDLIIANPPYVPKKVMKNLPIEYSFEPRQALIAGNKGLDFISRILQDAPPFLNQKGVLVLEAGVAAEELQRSKDLPFIWASFENGGDGVAVIEAKHLR